MMGAESETGRPRLNRSLLIDRLMKLTGLTLEEIESRCADWSNEQLKAEVVDHEQRRKEALKKYRRQRHP